VSLLPCPVIPDWETLSSVGNSQSSTTGERILSFTTHIPNTNQFKYSYLDNGAELTLKKGDVCVQRGTIHGWENKSDKPARVYFILTGGTSPNYPIHSFIHSSGCMHSWYLTQTGC
jgi:hypothetical protein